MSFLKYLVSSVPQQTEGASRHYALCISLLQAKGETIWSPFHCSLREILVIDGLTQGFARPVKPTLNTSGCIW
jgi:hypothetical protein